ncbi:MAG: FAD-binding oxidoreductase [Proteobacteria bacterium]|nr:FAD-binding oxidoreductase [Pseudomonadota bacterium]MDA0927790.1 FAD-binding oxidoreductase [Pseudomonadota bacterium]
MQLSGWGNYPAVQADVLAPASAAELQSLLAHNAYGNWICRGGGRSYGDSALNGRVVSSRYLDHFLDIDEDAATVRCGSGVSLGQVLEVVIPRGLFPPVLPGTKHVSIGGAIAADIHGKNHHVEGSFCDHLESFSLLLADGSILRCSAAENAGLFHATCGGMGLTGIILDATLHLNKVSSVSINNRSFSAKNLQHCLELLDEHNAATYVVAWLDCLKQGEDLGRGIVYVGDHGDDDNLQLVKRRGLSVPFHTPGFFLNRFTMSQFNNLYASWNKGRGDTTLQNYEQFFFPLDSIGNWNRLYGRKGFLQYQVLVPTEAKDILSRIIRRVAESGQGSFLSVLKKFGKANNNPLSFPSAGYTLTLDFRWRESLFPLLDELDALVLGCGGRHYLAKDARLSESGFKTGYPRWQEFMQVKAEVDPHNRFASLQSQRLGLTPVSTSHSSHKKAGPDK